MKESLVSLLPWLSSSTYTGSFTADQLRQTIRSEFRNPSKNEATDSINDTSTTIPASNYPPDLLDRAFTSLRVLEEQLHMARCSSTAITDSIRVDVCSAFVGTQAELDPTYDPDDETVPPKMYYTYRVRVSNTGYVEKGSRKKLLFFPSDACLPSSLSANFFIHLRKFKRDGGIVFNLTRLPQIIILCLLGDLLMVTFAETSEGKHFEENNFFLSIHKSPAIIF
jgi:hypothetical protein